MVSSCLKGSHNQDKFGVFFLFSRTLLWSQHNTWP